jgi:hypothetical protein
MHAGLRRLLMRLNRISAVGEQVRKIAENKQNGIAAAEPRQIQDIRQMGYRERVRTRCHHRFPHLLQSILRKHSHKKRRRPLSPPFQPRIRFAVTRESAAASGRRAAPVMIL